ncbi:TonB-dependent receptor [Saccharibacter sp. 17.LH.SD]|uniref:TonB-dependent receptor n=1 Tax=Saccharibacter sp. 17.LH.SD TaxID=2689393 RepID=UPI0013711F71|nr:TonB-dependent receptor [Saccharibacter sp. 17.LH.SD]MXV44694.1 TonB-dependent receptor [Saccharibacter sp. 17.LH.SD]
MSNKFLLALFSLTGETLCCATGFAAPKHLNRAPHHPKSVSASTTERLVVRLGPIQRAAHTIDKETRALQNVPQAATRIDQRQLTAEHITSLPQATRLLPSVQFNISNPRVSGINIRGLGSTGTTPTDGIESGVAVTIDDVYRARPGTALTDLPDLNGITVLRGPSGSEGGMVTTAGSINLTTTAPDLFERHIKLEAGAGNYDYNRWNVQASTPIIRDKLAVSVSALGYGHSGWVKNRSGGGDINGMTNRSFRTQIFYKPTHEISLRIIADYAHLRQNCCIAGLYRADTTQLNGHPIDGNLMQRSAWAHYIPVTPSSKPYLLDRDSLTQANQEDSGLSAHLDWHHNNFTLSSITAYRWWNWYPHNDGDMNGIDAETDSRVKVHQNQFTQEFRFKSKWRSILDYQVGAFYMWQENRVFSEDHYGTAAGAWLGYGTPLSPVAGVSTAQATALLNNYRVLSYAQPTTNYYAAYARGTWHITHTLSLITGVRYNYGAKTGGYHQWESTPLSASAVGLSASKAQNVWDTYGSNSRYSAHLDNGFITGDFAIQYRPTRHTMLYARYGRGGKSGGLNLTPLAIQSLQTGALSPNVGKETDDAFEVGSKQEFLQGRLFFDVALYQTNDHNYQVSTTRSFQGALLSSLSNAPKVRIRGAESDIHFSPLPNLITTLSASYNDAQFLKYTTSAPPEIPTAGPYNLNHTAIPFVPRWSLAVSARYDHHIKLKNIGVFDTYIGGSYSYHTRENTSANNSINAWVPAYGTLNLNFGIKPLSGKWELSGFINNATNVRHITQIIQGSGISADGAWYAYVTQPRSFGFIARARF